MVRRAALSSRRVVSPRRFRRAWRPSLILLAISLVLTMAGSISAQAGLEARLVPVGTVLSSYIEAPFAANEDAPSASWRADPGPASRGRSLLAHAAKMKRAAARAGQRTPRWLPAPAPDRAKPVVTAMTLAVITDPSVEWRNGLLFADHGHPLRAPPDEAY